MRSRIRRFVVPSMAVVLALAWLAPAAPPAVRAATTLNVPAQHATIGAALAVAVDGDTVLVAPGTYTETLNVFASISLESAEGSEVTTIQGSDGGEPVISIQAQAGETPAVRGFTITGGSGQFGGGIYLLGQGSATIADNVISGNSGGSSGGGIDINGGGSSVIERNVIADNTAQLGGGISVVNAMTPVFRNNVIAGNTASGTGGGMYVSTPSGSPGPTVRNNTIAANEAAVDGSALFAGGYDATALFTSNSFTGATSAALVTCQTGSDGAPPQFRFNNVYNRDGPAVAGLCELALAGDGNRSTDPPYVDAFRGDYHLRPNSLLIDAGENAGAPPTDIDAQARPHDGNEDGTPTVDIGADEATDPLLVNPAYAYFGNVDVGASAPETVTLVNYGGGPLSITSVAISGPDGGEFTIAEPLDDTCTGATLAVADSCLIEVQFAPTEIGTRLATLTITGPGAMGTRTVPLEGLGLDPILVIGGPMTFAGTPVGTTSPAQPAQINNYGLPATVSSVILGGTHAADFAIMDDGCTGYEIPTAQACTFDVAFTPRAAGARTAVVTISGPAPMGERILQVSGTGTAPASSVSWGTTYTAGPSYSWNSGYALGRTVQGSTQRLHGLYATDRVSGTWAGDGGPFAGVYYTRASSGATWSTGRRLNPTNQHAVRLGLASAVNRVYAAWVSQTRIANVSSTAPRVLYVRANTNHGEPAYWRSAIRLTSTTGRIDYPTIAASGYDLHVAWTDSITGSVKVASSKDRGATFRTVSVGTTAAGTTSNKAGVPSVAVAGSTVVVTWVSANTGTVKARVSADRGATWGTTKTVASSSWGFVAAAVRGSRVAVVWTGSQGVVLAMRTSGTWKAPVVAVPDDGVHLQYAPAVALQDTNRVGIAFAEAADTADWSTLRWVESPDGGAKWYQPQSLGATNVSGSRRANDWPSIVWPSTSTRYVTWNGWTVNTNYYRLYLRKGTGTPAAIATAASAFDEVEGGVGRTPAWGSGQGPAKDGTRGSR